MASTGTGSSGRKPVSQPKGDVTNPQPMKDASSSTVTKRLYRKYFMSLSNIFLIIFNDIILKGHVQMIFKKNHDNALTPGAKCFGGQKIH